jgi:hypothetical protein
MTTTTNPAAAARPDGATWLESPHHQTWTTDQALRQLGHDINHYTPREAEFCCNAIVGFNFGDGHLHNEHLIHAIQKGCRFAPGELIVVWVEAEPVFNAHQQYWVMDAAVGVVERGSWAVKDAVIEQPWLPNGAIPTRIDSRTNGYERVSHPRAELTPVAQATTAGLEVTA